MSDLGRPVEIDGSMLEGGGQIIRTSVALSALTGTPVHVTKIRVKRQNPGLRIQHLRGIEAVAGLCEGRLENARIGSKDIWFYPDKVEKNEIDINLETAASTGLVMQTLLTSLSRVKEKTTVNINGGSTFSKWAPPLQYIQFVLLPVLRRMGYNAEMNILAHGFYPVGGARVQVIIHPARELKPIELVKRGDVGIIEGVSVASASLKKPRVAERQARTAEASLKDAGYDVNMKTRYSDSRCPGSGIVLFAKTGNGGIIGSDGLGERGRPAEDVGEEAAERLLETLETGAALDEHLSDQLLAFMAFAQGNSSISAPALTMHARTNMEVIRRFLPVEFSAEEKGRNIIIDCIHR